MKEKPFLKSHKIYLRNPIEDDFVNQNWHSWFNDQNTTKFNQHGIYPISREEEIKFRSKLESSKSTISLAIVELKNDRLVGTASLYNIDLINRRCNISIAIGEKSYISTGIEAYGLLIEHAFNRLNINRIQDGTHEKLIKFLQMLKSIGFKKDGICKEYYFRDGKYHDLIMFSILAKDFYRLKKERGGFLLFKEYKDLVEEIKKNSKIAL